jgi:phosphatidylserine/phosphatidylglycerophosphate/cardiolipin synthase-like enzyme
MLSLSKLIPKHRSIYLCGAETRLYDQNTFYKAFIADLNQAKKEVIIESPFITKKRLSLLMPSLKNLNSRGIHVTVNARDPLDGEDTYYKNEFSEAVSELQELGVLVLYTIRHHRKLAIIDKQTLWEGSLNILSHNDSCEMM